VDNHGNPLRPSATLPVRGPAPGVVGASERGSSRRTGHGSGPGDITGSSRSADRGSGPGPITPDGCAVELYALLPPMGEPELVHAAIPAGASILELGAGAGRMTARLVELGHPVVAVDESAEMLAHVRGAETVRVRIQDLALGRRFDAVLLASFLVNTPDRALRGRFLRACREHVADGGQVLVQRHPPAWFDDAAEGEQTIEGITFRLRDLGRPGPGLLAATAEYQVGERTWTRHSPPSASTTPPWPPPWPGPGWPWTPT
jgi:SAM-dependent methyltransferase